MPLCALTPRCVASRTCATERSPLTRSYYMANYPTISLALFLALFASVEMSVAGAIWLYTVVSLDHSEAPR